MRTISLLGLATVSALAFAPAAFAQDTASDTASGKHWAVVGGGVMLQPKDDAAPGIRKVDGALAPTISGSYFFNDNLAVELWGAAAAAQRQAQTGFQVLDVAAHRAGADVQDRKSVV